MRRYTFWGYGAAADPGFRPGIARQHNQRSWDAGGTNGGRVPLYAVGGPRSGQLTLKITF